MADERTLVMTDNRAARRFEAGAGGALAVAEYTRAGNVIAFTRTRIPDALSRRGAGDQLIRGALEHARACRLTVVPLCPCFVAYIRRHPQYAGLVDPEYRALVSPE